MVSHWQRMHRLLILSYTKKVMISFAQSQGEVKCSSQGNAHCLRSIIVHAPFTIFISHSSNTSAIELIGVYFKLPDFLMPRLTAELMNFF